MRLLTSPPARLTGEIRFKGRDLLALSDAEMRKVRGGEIGMVFQEPMASLNPVMTVGEQIAEAVRLHQGVHGHEARKRALDLLGLVGIPAPERRMTEYPHKLSGGMRQRVMIAMALAGDPALLIADEPTTALDVTVQAQILDLIRSVKTRLGSAVMLITHDLGVVAELADRVAVMYAGRMVEETSVGELFAAPRHPYTRSLLAAAPRLTGKSEARVRGRMAEIAGSVPDFRRPMAGCPFAPRCGVAEARCLESVPTLRSIGAGHSVACHRAPISAAA
jgi:peptide/nickel transport system ATP-binding protein